MATEAERASEEWQRSPHADHMLLLLNAQQQSDLYAKLRDYVRWLLAAQSDEQAQAEFEREREELESYLKEKVHAMEMSGSAAKHKRGEWVWRKALQLSRDTAVFLTVYETHQSGLSEKLTRDSSLTRRVVTEHIRHIEAEQAEALRSLISNPFEAHR